MNDSTHFDILLGAHRIIPILTIDDLATAVPLAHALVAGGLPVLEITLRTPQALEAMRMIRAEVPGSIVGAGTVLTPKDLDASINAGAVFAVSPGATPALLKAGRDCAIPYLPAVATASEIMQGLDEGYTQFKFFPAESNGGTAALKSLAAPLGRARFCATGGISDSNLAQYMALRNVNCVGGSWMIDPALFKAGEWSQISQTAARIAGLVAALRPNAA